MGRVLGGLVSLVLGVIVTLGLTVAPAAAASKHTSHHGHHAAKTVQLAKTSHVTKVTKLAQLGHGSFWECPSGTTELLIGINRAVLHPGQVLDMNFIAKNNASIACNYVAPYANGPGRTVSSTLQIGPCGSIAFKIIGAHNREVWPGLVPFNCPALGFAEMLPGATVSGLGTWNQTLPNSTKRIPAGSYTLIIANDFSFPITVVSN
jgi:hypothetical protein